MTGWTRLVRIAVSLLVLAAASAGCEDDPHDLDFAHDAATPVPDAAVDAGKDAAAADSGSTDDASTDTDDASSEDAG